MVGDRDAVDSWFQSHSEGTADKGASVGSKPASRCADQVDARFEGLFGCPLGLVPTSAVGQVCVLDRLAPRPLIGRETGCANPDVNMSLPAEHPASILEW